MAKDPEQEVFEESDGDAETEFAGSHTAEARKAIAYYRTHLNRGLYAPRDGETAITPTLGTVHFVELLDHAEMLCDEFDKSDTSDERREELGGLIESVFPRIEDQWINVDHDAVGGDAVPTGRPFIVPKGWSDPARAH